MVVPSPAAVELLCHKWQRCESDPDRPEKQSTTPVPSSAIISIVQYHGGINRMMNGNPRIRGASREPKRLGRGMTGGVGLGRAIDRPHKDVGTIDGTGGSSSMVE